MDEAAVVAAVAAGSTCDGYSVLVDLVSGTIAGCAGTTVGHPLDTIKVRLQTHSQVYKGSIDCFRQTFAHEGARGFFKGLTSPLFGSAWTTAIMFASYERSLRVLDTASHAPVLSSVFAAGLVSGSCRAIVLTPTDLIKCRLQVQDGHASSHYRGPVDCIKHIYARNGIRGLFLGYPITLLREVPSFGVYFSVYEYTKRQLIAADVNAHTAMLTAGGLAGAGSWIVGYPMDVVKSSIQTVAEDAQPIEKTIAYQTRRLYRLGGARIFVKGLETAVIRAFPVNAVTFYCYENLSENDALEQKYQKRDDASTRLGEKMLQGWTLLGQTCPVEGCHTPFVRNKQMQMYCVNCEQFAVTAEQHAQQQEQQRTAERAEEEALRERELLIAQRFRADEQRKADAAQQQQLDRTAATQPPSAPKRKSAQVPLTADAGSDRVKALRSEALAALYEKVATLTQALSASDHSERLVALTTTIQNLTTAIQTLSSTPAE